MAKLLIDQIVTYDYPKCLVITKHGETMEQQTVEVAHSINDQNLKVDDIVEIIEELIKATKTFYVANYPNPADVREMIKKDIETMQALIKENQAQAG